MAGPKTSHLPYADEDWFKHQPNGPQFKARTELTDKQSEFIDWLLDPSPDKGTHPEWAKAHEVSERTLRLWKKSKLFTDEWERRAAKINGGVERIQKIVDKLYDQALTGDVKAMQLYLQYVDKFTPKKAIVTETKPLEELSNEELADLAENVVVLRKAQ